MLKINSNYKLIIFLSLGFAFAVWDLWYEATFYSDNYSRIEKGTQYELQHDTTLKYYVRPGVPLSQVARINAIANLRKNIYFYDDAKRRNKNSEK